MKKIFLALLLWPSLCFAAPSITSVTGDFVNGGTITITGMAFGNGPTVRLFDDFSGGTVGQVHPTSAVVGTWDTAQCVTWADSTLSNSKGARCIKSTILNGSTGKLNSIVTWPLASEVFLSSIAYVPPGYKFPSASEVYAFPGVSALKHHWFMYGNSGDSSTSAPDIVSPTWSGAKFSRVSSNDAGGPSTFDNNSGTPEELVAWAWDEPVRWSIWAKGNGLSASGSDGMFQAVSTTVGLRQRSYTNYKAWFASTNTVYGWDRVKILGYARSGADLDQGHNWVVDDVYVATGSNAAARIEIGNAPNYASCNKLAILTPTAWTSTEITATVRLGLFDAHDPNDEVYLFVVDSTNAASAGELVLLGDPDYTTCYKDADGDLYAETGYSETVTSCSPDYYPSSQLTATVGDCDDDDNAINPGETEILDNAVDEDCDGVVGVTPPSNAIRLKPNGNAYGRMK